jgi:hypothetical protein
VRICVHACERICVCACVRAHMRVCMRASAYACVHVCVRICVYMHTRICVFMRWHTVHAFQRGHDRIHRNCRMPLGSAEHRRKPLRRVKKAEGVARKPHVPIAA